jgi:tyramine---L-glutamate ligase
MKVGLLEWVCGGGLSDIPIDNISLTLRAEGWGMLTSVATDLIASGHEVVVALDPRLRPAVHDLRQAQILGQCRVVESVDLEQSLPNTWMSVAQSVDAVLVIAPEIGGALQTAIEKLNPVSSLLCNCYGDFLSNCCDKWFTAMRLAAAGVAHPATRLLVDVDSQWLDKHQAPTRKWVVKPRDGAGCEDIQLVQQSELLALRDKYYSQGTVSRWIVQPLLSGRSYSRSAIIGCDGRVHWMPLVTQLFEDGDHLIYRGGRVLVWLGEDFESNENHQTPCTQPLDAVVSAALAALGNGAFGWIGLDLLYSTQDQQWIVIEANPRLTTSFTGLDQSGGPGLMDKLIRACNGQTTVWDQTWKQVDFLLDCENSSKLAAH